ncbi:MAG: phosphoenolpyruvate carboxylase, partial [Rhodothermaceae bacterium]|nr:phosphoenolpyruvate carboxylase [Rhodothermaceae bacterium]
MSSWQELRFEAQGTGISVPLSEQINLLGGMLGHVIQTQASPEMLDMVEKLRHLAKQAISEQDIVLRREAIAQIKELKLQDIEWLLRAFTTFFYLVNQSEQQEIIRINRERARLLPEMGRADSIDEAVGMLHRANYPLEEVIKLVARLDIQPTLTAH